MSDYRALPPFAQPPFQTGTPLPPLQNEKTWYKEYDDGGAAWKLYTPETPVQQSVEQVTPIPRWWAQPFQQIITKMAPGKNQVAEDYSAPIAFPTPPVGKYTVDLITARPTLQSALINNVTVEKQPNTRIVPIQAPKPRKQVR